MTTIISSQEGTKLKLEVEIDLSGSLLNSEYEILRVSNEMSAVATKAKLNLLDTDGTAIIIGGIKFTSKGKRPRTYHTPYGSVDIERHVYQTSKGGETYCPLEQTGRIIYGSTPRFAQMLSSKYTRMNARETVTDLSENHDCKIALAYLQTITEVVGSIAQSKEEVWEYHVPKLDEPITTVAIGLDGAHVCVVKEGYREAMVGTISLYDIAGERQHTIYIGASPEYGKAKFTERLEHEINHIKLMYPSALYIGIADGAKSNWSFLEQHTSNQVLDFYHATEYLTDASCAISATESEQKAWLSERCSKLKNAENGVIEVLTEMQLLAGYSCKFILNHELQAEKNQFKKDQIIIVTDTKLAYQILEDGVMPQYSLTIKNTAQFNEICNHIESSCSSLSPKEMERLFTNYNKLDKPHLASDVTKKLNAAITYFSNNKDRMNYWEYVHKNLPIGSGVTEAACKTLVKHRCCASGMKWKMPGLKTILSLRALIQTTNRWEQFWDKIDQFGVPMAA
jgi:hypothetical protein